MPFFQRIGRDFLNLPQTPEIRIECLLQMMLFNDFNIFLRACRTLKNLNTDAASPLIAALSADYINTRGRKASSCGCHKGSAADDRIEFYRNNSHAKVRMYPGFWGSPGARANALKEKDSMIRYIGTESPRQREIAGVVDLRRELGDEMDEFVRSSVQEPTPSLTQTSSIPLLMQAR